MNELSRRRERDATQREVDKLRASIQTLTRSANPLGKLMDFMQEDVDSMQVNEANQFDRTPDKANELYFNPIEMNK